MRPAKEARNEYHYEKPNILRRVKKGGCNKKGGCGGGKAEEKQKKVSL
jgi:hypothetical protein